MINMQTPISKGIVTEIAEAEDGSGVGPATGMRVRLN